MTTPRVQRDDLPRGEHEVTHGQRQLVTNLFIEGMAVDDICWIANVSRTMFKNILDDMSVQAQGPDAPQRRLARLVVAAQDDARELSARVGKLRDDNNTD